MSTVGAESSKASVPDRAGSQAPEIDDRVGASTSEEGTCDDRETPQDAYNGCAPSRSRYGRTIKPRFTVNMAEDSPQNWRPKTHRQLLKEFDSSVDESIEEINVANNIDEVSDSSATLTSTEEFPSSRAISPTVECQWKVGQLAWARVGSFPFWPCMVTVDPTSRIYYKLRVTSKSIVMMIHVHYFGDKGRRSWVSGNCLMEFTGLDDFLKLSDSLTADAKKKDPKYAAAFIVKPGTRKKWQNAVDEITEVQSLTTDDRVAIFAPKVKTSKSRDSKSLTANEKNQNKRKRSRLSVEVEQDEPDSKHAKQDDVHNTEKPEITTKPRKSELTKKNSRVANGKIYSKPNSDSSPSSPSSHKSSPESTNARNLKNEEDEEENFNLYYDENKKLLEIEYPNYSKDDIKIFLRKSWDTMDADYREKYALYMNKNSHNNSRKSDSSKDNSRKLESSKDNSRKFDSSRKFENSKDNSRKFENSKDNSRKLENSKDNSLDEDEMSMEIDTSLKEKDEKEESKKTKSKTDREENSVSETKRSRLHNLFKGMKQEKVCQICEKTGKLTRCKGPCYSYFHLSCVKPGESSPEYSVDENTLDDRLLNEDVNIIKRSFKCDSENNAKSDEQEDETFKCIDCLSGVAPACFLCNEREGDRIRCIVPACGKHYHSDCLISWPQSHWQGGRLTCPYHVCHTCSSDNPQDKRSRAPNEKMARCVRCPSSYHASTLCLPAGSVILTASQIICPKHYKAPHPPLNAAWCFLCTRGGSLICCDTCPTSFHLECLGINAPDGGFICEDCETGRLPLYGEVVWVKLGHYRWWPSRICYPHEIPENVEALPHSPGKFCVMFLGSNDYYWVHRGRAFLYQDGDANIKPPVGKKTLMDDTYRIALQEANKIHQQLKARRSMTKEPKGLKPPPYVKLKVNKPVGNVRPAEVESIVACECDPEWDNPCAPGTDCLNRILMVECSPGICPAGDKCMNQSFVLRQYPAMEPFHTVGRGWGLRALEDIQAGLFVIEYVGEIIDDAEYKRRLHRKKELKNENFYFLTIDNNRTIDAEPKGNLSRFMNHSCAPNCETQKWTVNGDTRIGLFALRDIESGEELTFNYNLASDGETRKACLCGASNCSGFIGLKAQKQPVSAQLIPVVQPIVQLKKIEPKPKRIVRRWRKYMCWRCGQEIPDLDKFVVCSQRTCNKKYHKTCVVIDELTESKFCCPWHFCSECGRRTSAHCSFCSTAFCQVHLDGNLFDRESDKGGFVCKLHENADAQKPVEDEKEYSDNDNETDKEYSSTSSTSPVVMEKVATREPSPRVSIVEVR
ncbi:PREDICTED: histone-lysine N-methyltransferase NSD2 isoform X2 [Wasmannia auropunctata]|uniref:histone-lysine N-methyltransferase NSD2 isoform X2 n=1 Tax=Wasmannia auropunctata TaxID=64793 RepID=UPI0005EE7807|nr:PREDICTED: histone-lysine N-methyltransferase NSD2 isoform X2 [Wasmannia auropunctata]